MASQSSRWRHTDEVLYEQEPPKPEEPRFLNMMGLYPAWHAKASCLQMEDTLFFGASEPDVRPPYTLGEIKQARTLCAACPVIRECLVDALRNREQYGVWAGSTSKQRREMLGRIDSGDSGFGEEVEAHVTKLEAKHRLHVDIKGVIRE